MLALVLSPEGKLGDPVGDPDRDCRVGSITGLGFRDAVSLPEAVELEVTSPRALDCEPLRVGLELTPLDTSRVRRAVVDDDSDGDSERDGSRLRIGLGSGECAGDVDMDSPWTGR